MLSKIAAVALALCLAACHTPNPGPALGPYTPGPVVTPDPNAPGAPQFDPSSCARGVNRDTGDTCNGEPIN